MRFSRPRSLALQRSDRCQRKDTAFGQERGRRRCQVDEAPPTGGGRVSASSSAHGNQWWRRGATATARLAVRELTAGLPAGFDESGCGLGNFRTGTWISSSRTQSSVEWFYRYGRWLCFSRRICSNRSTCPPNLHNA
ncbi:hypothetical protein GWI33_018253 [Rhynchophorus ferrugineus]|uniref:Uncharacterized protein n=1 Tax=Rhynchophorus ferrugineus TaxID=354439 RepID=A0A834I0M7_RHYFE|nr:hypothetical protein GWI33_018253 [Rhynchophorus ferrugineus]